MLMAMLLAMQSPDEQSSLAWEQRTKIASMVWQSCNEQMAKEYAKGKDTAGDVADAAAAKCDSVGAKFEEYVTEYLIEKEGWGAGLAGEVARKQRAGLREAFRGKALVAVMDARAK